MLRSDASCSEMLTLLLDVIEGGLLCPDAKDRLKCGELIHHLTTLEGRARGEPWICLPKPRELEEAIVREPMSEQTSDTASMGWKASGSRYSSEAPISSTSPTSTVNRLAMLPPYIEAAEDGERSSKPSRPPLNRSLYGPLMQPHRCSRYRRHRQH